MSRDRRYVMRGHIRSLVQKTPTGASGVRQRYLMTGLMHFVGRRSDGTTVQIELEQEPEDANHVYPVANDLRVGEVDEDGESIDSGDDDEQASNGNRQYTGLRQHMIIVRDNDKIPLPHVGMYMSVALRRTNLLEQELLLDANGTPLTKPVDERRDETLYFQYEYVVDRVKTWKALQALRLRSMQSALTRVTYALASAQQRTQLDRSMESNKLRVNSLSVAMQQKRKARITVFCCEKAEWKTAITAVDKRQMTRTDTLNSLMRVGDAAPSVAARLLPAFANMYALRQDLTSACGGQRVERPPLELCVNQLRVGGRTLNCSSAAEVRAIDAWLADNEVHTVPFFGAYDLPLAEQSAPLLANWPGFEWNRLRDRVVTRRANKFIQARVLETHKCSDTPDHFELAYRLHREQQRPWRRDHAIVDVGAVVNAVNRFFYRGRDLEPINDDQLRIALAFLEEIGAWRRVPDTTELRLSLHQTRPPTENGASWYCTQRHYTLAASLAQSALMMDRQLQLCALPYTGLVPSAMHSNAVVLYAGAQPLRKQVGKHTPRIAVHSLLAELGATACNEPYAADLAAYEQLVVLDTHLLTRAELDQLLRVLWSACWSGTRVLLCGDSALETSEFCVLVNSGQFELVVAENATGDRLRQAAHAAMLGSGNARQQLMAAIAPIAERSVNTTWRDQWHANNRFVLLAPYRREQSELLANMAATCANDELAREFRLLADEPTLMQHTVFTRAPFVAYRNTTCRIVRAYTMVKVPNRLEALNKTDCVPVPFDGEHVRRTLSLDAPDLLVELFALDFDGVDHRRCCHTWDANVMLVSRHRHELVAQSLTTCDTVAPPAFSAKQNAPLTVCFGESYRLDDVHRTFSLGVHDAEALTTLNLDMELFAQHCSDRYPQHTRSLLVDMLAK